MSTGKGAPPSTAGGKDRFRFAAPAAIEHFGDRALIFLPELDRLVTTNRAAAELLQECLAGFPDGSFDLASLAGLLVRRYRLSGRDAAREASAAVRGWLDHGICRKIVQH